MNGIAPRLSLAVLLFLLVAVAPAPPAARADETRPADVTIEVTNWSAGLLFGYRWGSGVLEYQGQRYPFRVHGFSLLDLGVSKATITGQVYGLTSREEFAGRYSMFTAGGPWGENELDNGRGVRIRWAADAAGVEAKLGFDRIRFTFEP